jgi:voltage-gated potassium channel
MGDDAVVAVRRSSNAYELFIFVLTVLSLFVMAGLFLPVSDATQHLLLVYDNLICVVFLVDFGIRMKRARVKRDYFIAERGWLDLLGSVPGFGFFTLSAILRLARLSRLARITRLLRGEGRREIARDIVENRGQYAAFITVLSAFLVLVLASILMIQFESTVEGANIESGADALWWAVVTITTVGYGDRFPVSGAGRITAFLVMMAGVGIIGALASILASILVPQPGEMSEEGSDTATELAAMRTELEALRRSVDELASR